jgi:hypothetical protein
MRTYAHGFQGVKGCRAKADVHHQQRVVLAPKILETYAYNIKVLLHNFQRILQRSVSQTSFHADRNCRGVPLTRRRQAETAQLAGTDVRRSSTKVHHR